MCVHAQCGCVNARDGLLEPTLCGVFHVSVVHRRMNIVHGFSSIHVYVLYFL